MASVALKSVVSPAFKVLPTPGTFLKAAGGARLVSPGKPIINKTSAMNGGAWSAPDLVSYYLKRASAQQRTNFPYQDPRMYTMSPPNGGIIKPRDYGIWNGSLFRVAYFAGGTDEQCVDAGLSGEWYVSFEDMLTVVGASGSATDLGYNLRSYLALGFELDRTKTRILQAEVAGPIAAYIGKGAATSENYDDNAFPIYNGSPLVSQIFIPGIRDTTGTPNGPTIASCFDVGRTNILDMDGLFSRYSHK